MKKRFRVEPYSLFWRLSGAIVSAFRVEYARDEEEAFKKHFSKMGGWTEDYARESFFAKKDEVSPK